MAIRIRFAQIVLLSITFGSIACSYGHYPPQLVGGRPFDLAAASSIEPGTAKEVVELRLGEPYQRRSSEKGDVWLYFSETNREHVRYFLGLVPVRSTSVTISCAEINFDGGRVTRSSIQTGHRLSKSSPCFALADAA